MNESALLTFPSHFSVIVLSECISWIQFSRKSMCFIRPTPSTQSANPIAADASHLIAGLSGMAMATVTRSQQNQIKSMVDELVNYKVLMI